LKQKNAAKAKKHDEMGKKHKPQHHSKNMKTLPHHRIIPTQTLQGNNRKITPQTEEKIRQTIKEKPDITLQELIDELSLNVSESGLSRRLKKMGLTYRKRCSIQMGRNDQTSSKPVKHGVKTK